MILVTVSMMKSNGSASQHYQQHPGRPVMSIPIAKCKEIDQSCSKLYLYLFHVIYYYK